MKNKIAYAIILAVCLLLIENLALADENYKVYLSKDRYTVGENVVVNVEVTNQGSNESKVLWYISFSPEINQHPATLVGEASIQPHQTYYKSHETEIQIPGDHMASIQFYDSDFNVLYNETLHFYASKPMNVILLLPIVIVVMGVAVAVLFYKRKNDEWKKLKGKYE